MTEDEQKQFDAMQVEQPEPPKEEAPKTQEPEKEIEKTVPLAALHEARNENKELRGQLKTLQGVVEQGDKKLQTFIDSVRKQVDAGPRFEDDPAGALKHENETLKAEIKQVQDKVAGNDQAALQNQNLQKFSAQLQAKEREFTKANADYPKAAEYVTELWRDEFREAGFEDSEIPNLVFQKSLGVTHQAMQKGRDPAEAVYKIAKRYGFSAQQKPDNESKLKTIEKGQEAAKNNSGGGGPEDMSLASLAQMDGDAIDKLVSDPAWWSKNIRRSPLH